MAGEERNGGFLGQLRSNSILIIVTLVVNLIFTVFWVATQAARISVTEVAIASNKTLIDANAKYLQDFSARVDRLDTPLARRVVDMERQHELMDSRLRSLAERTAVLERVLTSTPAR